MRQLEMETSKKNPPPFPIPRRNVQSSRQAGLLALLHPLTLLPIQKCTVDCFVIVSIYSCGDSDGFTPFFPFKLHIVVPSLELTQYIVLFQQNLVQHVLKCSAKLFLKLLTKFDSIRLFLAHKQLKIMLFLYTSDDKIRHKE